VAFTVELLMPQTLLLLLPLPCAFLQQRKNIEGSLFLIKRRTQPRFQMLVLNKLSTGAVVCTTAAVSSIWPTRTAWGVLSKWSSCITYMKLTLLFCDRHVSLLISVVAADNYTEPIHGGLELESNPPYLMYTHGNDEVRHTCKRGMFSGLKNLQQLSVF
jgi:hypothetical protein